MWPGTAATGVRRIDLGVMGRQEVKREALDELCLMGWVTEEDGSHNSQSTAREHQEWRSGSRRLMRMLQQTQIRHQREGAGAGAEPEGEPEAPDEEPDNG